MSKILDFELISHITLYASLLKVFFSSEKAEQGILKWLTPSAKIGITSADASRLGMKQLCSY